MSGAEEDSSTVWRLSKAICPTRRVRLLDPANTFPTIVERLSANRVLLARWNWGREVEVRGRVRVEFEILVGAEAYDLFHNGIDGYRARFYRDTVAGEQVNADALASLMPALIDAAIANQLHNDSGFAGTLDVRRARETVACSLQGAGAKLWISESELTTRYGEGYPLRSTTCAMSFAYDAGWSRLATVALALARLMHSSLARAHSSSSRRSAIAEFYERFLRDVSRHEINEPSLFQG